MKRPVISPPLVADTSPRWSDGAVPASHHNDVLLRAYRRAEALEEKLALALEPLFARAGEIAAERFQQLAVTKSVAASLGLRGAYDVGAQATMVALYPRPSEAEALARDDGLPADTLHVTLAFLGDYAGDLAAVADALRRVAADHGPLEGDVTGAGRFGGAGVEVLLPDVAGLSELRVAVTEALTGAQVDYSRDHGFLPHMTSLDHIPDDPPDLAPVGEPLHFDSLWVVRGNEERVEIPLTGVAPLTAAAIPPDFCLPGALADALAPVKQAVVSTVSDAVLGELRLSFDVTNPMFGKALAVSAQNVTGITKTTQADIMRAIKASYKSGLSIPDTAKAIQETMKGASLARATMIARTEMAGSVNGASLAAAQIVEDATGAAYTKVWLTAPGARFPRHEEYDGLDGQTAEMDQPFEVGDALLMYPGDPDGDPGEVINCRCTIIYEDSGGQEVAEGDADNPGDVTASVRPEWEWLTPEEPWEWSLTAGADWIAPSSEELLSSQCLSVRPGLAEAPPTNPSKQAAYEYLQKYGTGRAAAEALNRDGILTETGKPWTAGQVRNQAKLHVAATSTEPVPAVAKVVETSTATTAVKPAATTPGLVKLRSIHADRPEAGAFSLNRPAAEKYLPTVLDAGKSFMDEVESRVSLGSHMDWKASDVGSKVTSGFTRQVMDDYVRAMQEVVREIRPLANGQDYRAFFSKAAGSKAIRDSLVNMANALGNYPADWARGMADWLNLKGRTYGPDTITVKNGTARGGWSRASAQMKLSGTPGSTSEYKTAVHELGHVMESWAKNINMLEGAYYDKRTEGEALTHLPFSKTEYTRPDKWFDSYVGRDYGRDSFEILSMGMQALFGGNPYEFWKIMTEDPELVQFILGLLVSA